MADQQEDKGYEVIDKRKVKMGEDGEVKAEPEAEKAQATADVGSEQQAFSQEEMANLPPVDVYSLVKSFIGILGAHAWQWLGLVKNPVTGQMEKDLSQAKVAIDSIRTLIQQIEDKLEPTEQRELKGLIADLQINYVQQSAKE